MATLRGQRERHQVELEEARRDAAAASATAVRLAAVAEACRAVAGRLASVADDERHWLLQRLGVRVTWPKAGSVDVSGFLPEVDALSAAAGLERRVA